MHAELALLRMQLKQAQEGAAEGTSRAEKALQAAQAGTEAAAASGKSALASLPPLMHLSFTWLLRKLFKVCMAPFTCMFRFYGLSVPGTMTPCSFQRGRRQSCSWGRTILEKRKQLPSALATKPLPCLRSVRASKLNLTVQGVGAHMTVLGLIVTGSDDLCSCGRGQGVRCGRQGL